MTMINDSAKWVAYGIGVSQEEGPVLCWIQAKEVNNYKLIIEGELRYVPTTDF